MTLAELLLVGFFAVWLVLTVLVQVPRINAFLRRWDLFCLLPEWRFFAPTPAQHNVHLLYRDEFPDGRLTEWTEAVVVRQRSGWACVFNTEKRGSKALIDAVGELCRHITLKAGLLETSIAYLTFLNYISRIPRIAMPSRSQFMLMRTDHDGSREEDIVLFVSELHDL